MSATEILEQIEHLPRTEQQQVAEKILEKYGAFDDELIPGEAELIDRRLQDHLQNPDDVVSLEEVKAKLDAKYRK
jgi:putative addiction module component (TIGR02574 family)